MNIPTLFKNNKKVLSFEVFPPKKTGSLSNIFDTIKDLKFLNPDFISVTYGAGGSENNTATIDIATYIKNQNLESVAHFPCINLTKSDVIVVLDTLKKLGISNILALRGDIHSKPKISDFKYASDLISFIKSYADFNIIAACYPEGHCESTSTIDDIHHLKQKVDAGTNHLITQLFFDNDYFYNFKEKASIAGISIPIQAGIMPVVNKKQIERIVSLCGVHVPKKFITIMDRYEHNPLALRDAGIAYAIDQIVDLITQGVDGIHLYTMNNPYIARKICEAISTLIAS